MAIKAALLIKKTIIIHFILSLSKVVTVFPPFPIGNHRGHHHARIILVTVWTLSLGEVGGVKFV